MKALRQLGSGFIIGAISLLLVIGGISLALTESSTSASPPTPSPIPTTFAVEFASPLPSPTFPPPLIPTETQVAIPSPTLFVPQPTVTACTVPGNWIPVTVGTNDTLYTIAERYNTTVEELNQKNCLDLQNPAPGAVIYVPAVPTKVVVPCGPPAGWVKRHIVQRSENLFRIALSYGITYPQLQAGNCMGTSTTIFVGQVLWVPNVPTRTPTATIASTSTRTPDLSTPTNTATKTPDFSTSTPPSTPTSTFIVTSSPMPTSTPAPTQTLTPFPSPTATSP